MSNRKHPLHLKWLRLKFRVLQNKSYHVCWGKQENLCHIFPCLPARQSFGQTTPAWVMPELIQWNPQKLFQWPLLWYQKQHRHKTPTKTNKRKTSTNQPLEEKKKWKRSWNIQGAIIFWNYPRSRRSVSRIQLSACKHQLCCIVSPTLQKLSAAKRGYQQRCECAASNERSWCFSWSVCLQDFTVLKQTVLIPCLQIWRPSMLLDPWWNSHFNS